MTARPSPLFLASAGLFAIALALLYAAGAPWRAGLGLDAFQHLASVRELARGGFPPRHNLVAGALPQGHYGPYLVGLGALARLTGATPQAALYAAGVLGLLLFLFAAHAVTLLLLGAAAARWSALTVVLLWGPWPWSLTAFGAWGWPGTTSLADPQNFFYPQQAGLVLLLALLVRLLPAPPTDAAATARRGRKRLRQGLATLLLAALLVASHPLTGLAFAVAVAALAVSELLAGRVRGALLLLLLPVAALGVAAAWPYYPLLGLLKAFALPALRVPMMPGPASAPASIVPIAPPLPTFEVLGPAALGVLACLELARRRRFFLPLWSLACLLLARFPLVPLHQRFLFYAALPLQIAATGLLARAWCRARVGKAAVLLLLGSGAFSAALRIHWLLQQERPDLGFVSRLLPESAVVLCSPGIANGVAGLTGRRVVLPENPDLFLMMAGGARRAQDVREFLAPGTSASRRAEIVERWQVTHALVDRLSGPVGPALPYPVLYEGGGYVLYAVAKGLASGAGPGR